MKKWSSAQLIKKECGFGESPGRKRKDRGNGKMPNAINASFQRGTRGKSLGIDPNPIRTSATPIEID